MSTKFLYSLTDENPDLQKQIGCMNGIFQLFDSQRFLPRRLTKGHSHKRLPPPAQSSNHGMDANNALQKDKDKSLKRVVKEKQRISTESSRTSFSSSCSSSFSSLDCNKAAQLETPSFSQTIFHETPSGDLPMNQQNASLQFSQHSLDIRDVVKNSMHREARALSVKTATKGEAVSRGLKHIDSPRPMQPPKSAKTRVSGLNESYRVLGRPQDATWNSIEENDLKMKDAPRFSYDGRESRDILKSAIKLKELPRLSLDSKAGSIRGTTSEIKSNNHLRDLQRGCGKSKKILNAQQELESCKQPSTVVAKLMGLEGFPDFMSINESSIRPIKTCRDEGFDPFSKTPSRTVKNKQNRISGSPMTSQPFSPQSINADLVKKPTPSSRFPIEPAPWRQPDVTPASQITTSKCREAPPKTSNSSPSVYGEIEKRLTELEFKKSGKDLRALKQMLEAMQKTKVMLATQKEDWASNFVSETDNNSSSLGGSVKLQNPRNLQGNSTNSGTTTKGTNSPRGIKSPIVIMKPANFIKKASNPASSEIPTDRLAGICKHQTADYAERKKESVDKRMTKNPTARNNRLKYPSSRPLNSMEKNTSTRAFRSTQTSHITGENTTNSSRGSGTVSPRLQQKKLGLEMQSRPTTQSSDLSKTSRRQPSRQLTESGSPGKKFQPKSPNLQRSHYQLNEAYSNMRHLSYQGDAVSLQSESNISLVSHGDTEFTSTNRSSVCGISLEQDDHKQKNPAARLSEDRSMETPAISTLEQPSPISVLDSTFYNDDLPSPVKKISNAFNDDETQDDDEAAWKPLELNHLANGTKPSLGFENDHKILEIQHLVRDLEQMNSTHDESIHENIASLGKNTNLDHKYISEILLASGYLTGIESGSETVHPINRNLFLALEQTKASISFSDDEYISENIFQTKSNDKIRRKLIFDAVQEILVRKLELEGSSKQWQNKVAGRRIGSQQQLLKELCSEIDQIQANKSNCSLDDEDDWLRGILWEDFMHRSMDWANYQSEISKVVLDVERLIFKDLISEAVGSVAVGVRTWPDRHCRQLFLK